MATISYSQINAYKDQFQSEAYTFARSLGINTGAHNGQLDAFRHAYVSARMTQQFSPAIANLLGQINEIKGDIQNNQPAAEKNMDLWNNAIGRQIGSVPLTPAQIGQKVADAIHNGELIINPFDSRLYQDVPPTQLNNTFTDPLGNSVNVDVTNQSIAEHDMSEGDFVLTKTTDSAGHTLKLVTINDDYSSTTLDQTYNSSGQLTSRNITNENAAGTANTLAEDQNGDGVVDKTTTKLDADHNGKPESTVVAITGGDTTNSVDANQNGSYETVNTLHTNGQRDVRETDEANALWSTKDSHYDTLGRLDTLDTTADSGALNGIRTNIYKRMGQCHRHMVVLRSALNSNTQAKRSNRQTTHTRVPMHRA